VAHCAHLGGIFLGFMFARRLARTRDAVLALAASAANSLNITPAPK
jgi:hypothetical protein